MRILYSCPLDPIKWAAAGSHVVSIVKALHSLGHRVTLLHVGSHVLQLNGIPQVAVGVDGDSLKCKLWRDIVLSREILRACRSGFYDVLYHRLVSSSFLPMLLAKGLGIPAVVEVNSDARSELPAWQAKWLQRRLVRLLEWINYVLADRIIAVTKGVGDSICQIYGISSSKIRIVSNGADLDTFRPMDRTHSCRLLRIDETKRYIAFAGTFQRWQGLETIAQAAIYVRQTHPDAVFLIIGDGIERPAFEALINSTGVSLLFRLPGWCSPEETALYLGASDICIAPYTRQAALGVNLDDTRGAPMSRSPLKICTYLASGRPIIASHFAEAGMLVESIGAGIAVPPERPDLLAQAISYLLEHPNEAKAMGEAGRKAAEANYGWQSVAKRIIEICTEIRDG